MRFLLAVALLAALTHVDASEVQGQLKGETQHAEQVVVEAKAGQSLRAGLLGSLSAPPRNCNCYEVVRGNTYYYEGGYNKCTCDQGCGCTSCFPPTGNVTYYDRNGLFMMANTTHLTRAELRENSPGTTGYGSCSCVKKWGNLAAFQPGAYACR
jgi:hypothetical protein